MKKIFTIALLGLATIAFAQNKSFDFAAVCESGQILYYNILNDNEVCVTFPGYPGWNGFTKPSGDLIIPDTVTYGLFGNTYAVTSISASAFYECTELTSVVIPNTVSSIGEYAFYNCSALESVVLPNGLTSIETLTFANCTSLTTVSVPDSLVCIKSFAFYECVNLSSFAFPSTLESIESAAFYHCESLSGELALPQSLHSLGEGCFSYCSGLDGVLTLPDSLNYIESYSFTHCTGFTGVVLPSCLLYIKSEAFNGCTGLSGNLIIPDHCSFIGEYAFYGCSGLSGDLIIPDQCTSIGGVAFADCVLLSSITIGESVRIIGPSAFSNCIGLQSIHCSTINPPTYNYSGTHYFNNVPTDIPVYVNCLTLDHFQSDPNWAQFTNMHGEFIGTPEITVSVNNPDFGVAEIISVPSDCDILTATVRAIPYEGHHFGCWKRGQAIASYNPEYTFTLNHDYDLTAYFDVTYVMSDSIGYPDQVIGRSYDNSGQITHEYPSEFIYDQDGKLTNFSFPSHLYTTFNFFEYPTMPNSILTEYGGHPYTYDRYDYVYVSNHLIHSSAYNSLDDIWAYFDYYYDANWHMTKKEKTVTDYYYNVLNTYQYEDNFRTVIDSCFYGYESLPLRTVTTSHYDERQRILNAQADSFNNNGEITSRLLQTYVYTPNNKTDSIISQTLTDGEWVNTSYTHYVYDDMKRVVEYQTGSWSAEEACWNISKKTTYDFDDEEQKLIVSFFKMNGDEWERDCFTDQTIFYDPELIEWQKAISYYNNYYLQTNQLEINLHYVTVEASFPRQSEWYYEIEWENGDITYQHLEYASDTTIGTERPKIIVRTNTIYDRDEHTEVTHEYILERDGKVYWWNKELEEFTTLYDYNAEAGDEWEIKVGTESILVHVDSVGVFEYEGDIRKMLHISDAGNIFNGDIVVGYGHMTSFFPEKLMNRNSDYTVDGLRCYWVGDALLYHNGDEDCDAIYSEIHGVDEDGPPTGSGTFMVYPNPANNILFVETVCTPPLPDQTTYRITNLMGQTLLQGHISAEIQQINISTLPAGMYFISVDAQTMKFVVK